MAYTFEDENGDLGFDLNIPGLEVLKDFFSEQDINLFPVLADFIELGWTAEPKVLAKECRRLMKLSRGQHNKSEVAFQVLASAASKAGEILILVM